MNTKEYVYSWHLSLRVDRPVEGCAMRPHAYMYGKKLDEREFHEKALGSGTTGVGGLGGSSLVLGMGLPHQPHTKVMKEPPPSHEFSYRWFRGPLHEACAYEGCPRRTSFSPHDWSKHALGGTDCALQCISTQSSLYKCTFCNANCFVLAWKTQYTVPKESSVSGMGAMGMGGSVSSGGIGLQHANGAGVLGVGGYGGMGGVGGDNQGSRHGTPNRSRSGSFDTDDELLYPDEAQSTRSNGSRSPGPPLDGMSTGSLQLAITSASSTTSLNKSMSNNNSNVGTPRGFLEGYNVGGGGGGGGDRKSVV